MKTSKLSIGVFLLTFALSSCSKQDVTLQNDTNCVEMEFTAGNTKTVLEGQSVKWQSGDAISIFDGSANNKFTTTNSGSKAVFKGTAHLNATYYAVYPYNADNTLSGTALTVNIPSEQTGVADGFAPGSNVSVGTTETTTLDMKNVCGYVKFSISGTNVKSVSISTVGTEKIAGKFDVTFDKNGCPVCASTDESDKKAALIPSGTAFEVGDYMFCLAPSKLSSGVFFTYKTADGKLYKKTVTALNEIVRKTPVYIGTLERDAVEIVPTLALDPVTKTTVFPGDKSMTIYLNTTCDDVTASVKAGATLSDVTVVKVSDSNFTVSFTNSSVDPTVYKDATIVFQATGVADLEVPIRQNGVLTLDLSDQSNPYGVPDTADDTERTITQNGYVFKYTHCKWYKSKWFMFAGVNSGNTYISFPAISGHTLKAVDYTNQWNKYTTSKLNGYITLYGDSSTKLTKKVENETVSEEEGTKVKHLVLGTYDSSVQPLENTAYQFWSGQAANSFPLKIELYYE